jgi:hypothetical protein
MDSIRSESVLIFLYPGISFVKQILMALFEVMHSYSLIPD